MDWRVWRQLVGSDWLERRYRLPPPSRVAQKSPAGEGGADEVSLVRLSDKHYVPFSARRRNTGDDVVDELILGIAPIKIAPICENLKLGDQIVRIGGDARAIEALWKQQMVGARSRRSRPST